MSTGAAKARNAPDCNQQRRGKTRLQPRNKDEERLQLATALSASAAEARQLIEVSQHRTSPTAVCADMTAAALAQTHAAAPESESEGEATGERCLLCYEKMQLLLCYGKKDAGAADGCAVCRHGCRHVSRHMR